MSKTKQEASANDEDDNGTTPSKSLIKGSAKKAKQEASIKDEHDSETAQPKSPTKGQAKKGIAKVKPRAKRSAEDDAGIEIQPVGKKNKKYDTMPPPRQIQKEHSGTDEDREIDRLLLQEHGDDGDDEGNGRADSAETAVGSGGSGEAGDAHDEGSEED